MPPDAAAIARLVTAETGLPFECRSVRPTAAVAEYELAPSGHSASQTFRLQAVLEWRAVEVSFHPGAYAGDLVAHMGAAGEPARRIFTEVLQACQDDHAEIRLRVNAVTRDSSDPTIWADPWSSVQLTIRKGQLNINDGDSVADLSELVIWIGRLGAAALALLPVEAEEAAEEENVVGFPEGAKSTVTVNRYERDRRNRAAAIAIHGYRCAGCDNLLSDRYGPAATTLIEIHHVTPVSRLVPDYVISPRIDLIPLCPNCHSVVHTRTPPLSIGELRALIEPATEHLDPQ